MTTLVTNEAPKKFRSEEEILAKAPIEVIFGETQYQIKPLTILKARAWRQQLVEAMNQIMGSLGKEVTGAEQLSNGLAFAFVQFPDKMADLVFAYAPELPRTEIEQTATDEQLTKAFARIVQVAFPFVAELGMLTHTSSLAASFRR